MDEAVNRYARDLIEAINAAVANDPAVQACRDRALAAGVDLDVSLEAVVSAKDAPESGGRETSAKVVPSPRQLPSPKRSFDITAADRRFLRSLRIASGEATGAPNRTPER